jgi:4-hydroxybenzoyl-CoA thioesterase
MSGYRLHLNVLSVHCDCAGVTQASKMQEMAQSVIETWFDVALDWPYARMLGADRVMPIVAQTRARFPAASRMGDHLVWRLTIARIGRTAMDVTLVAQCGAETRVEMEVTLVLSEHGTIHPCHWPETVRARAAEYLVQTQPA